MGNNMKEYYDSNVFFVVPESRNEATAFIKDYVRYLFSQPLGEDNSEEDEDEYPLYANDECDALIDFMVGLFDYVGVYTIVQEIYHIDPSFRDTYYLYFSNQHFQIKRYSRRISFFRGAFGELCEEKAGSLKCFYSIPKEERCCNSEKNVFIGSCVINPLPVGSIGRTLIDPQYCKCLKNSSAKKPYYLRTSKFRFTIMGMDFEVNAFPYRMQDQETMRCGEVTLLNLFEYYSNRFSDYRRVMPSDIINSERKNSHERVLPAGGLTYTMLTKVLSDYGFSPKLYSRSFIGGSPYSNVSKSDRLKRLVYYYVESGIPVALNLVPQNSSKNGHSLLCIGHGGINDEAAKTAISNRYVPWRACHQTNQKEFSNLDVNNMICVNPLINAADFYSDFVIIDDNQFLYQCKDFSELSKHPDLHVENIAVPLYKRMFLDAPNAYAIIESILFHPQLGISAWTEDWKDEHGLNMLMKGEPVVFRLFMVSSKHLKSFRIERDRNKTYAPLYGDFPLPRFVWLCELYRLDDYLGNTDMTSRSYKRPFGEILIDATSSSTRKEMSILWMRYPGKVVFKEPQKPTANFPKHNQFNCDYEEDDFFDAFDENLERYFW